MSASFYREVVQAIILYGSEAWVFLNSMANRIKGTHTELLRMITGKRAKHSGDGIWEMPGAEGIRESSGT